MSEPSSQALMKINEALHGAESKRLAGRFNSGRLNKFKEEIKWAAERAFAEHIIQNNPKLLDCTPESIQGALLDVAYSGLSLSPSLAHAYLIPYGKTCSFAPGYRGLCHLAYKSGALKSIQPNVVRQNDPEFRIWNDEKGRHLNHVEQTRGDAGDITHAYVLANLNVGGPPLITVMNRDQLNAVAAQAKRKGGGAVWTGPWYDQMCMKSVIRRAAKTWPKDTGGMMAHMMSVADKYDPVEFEDSPDKDAPEQELCMNLDQQTGLNDLLTDRGITPQSAPEWLRRYAQSKGYGSLDNMPARLYDEAHAALTKIMDERKHD